VKRKQYYCSLLYSYVFQELEYLLGEQLAREGNFIIQTQLDPQMQAQAEAALQSSVNAGSIYGFPKVQLLPLIPALAVLALTGGTDYKTSQFNRATQAYRQPGSTFKIFTYTAAIEQGISAGKFYSCAPLTWRGQRYRGCERSSGSVDTGIALLRM